jgi:hypothetical protein
MKKILFTLLVWFQVCSVQAAVTTEQAQSFLHYSGLNHMIDELPGMFQQQFNMQAVTGEDSAKQNAMQAALATAISQVQGNAIALNYLTKDADGAAMQKILAFLESPLGKRIVDAENVMNTPEGQTQLQGYAAQLATNPLPAARAKLLDALSASLQLEELMVGMMKGIFFSTVQVVRELQPAEKAEFMEKFMQDQWSQMEGMMRAQMLQAATASVYFTYKGMSDQDLMDYAAFMRSATGQSYLKLGMDITQRYVNELTASLIRSSAGAK